MIVDLTNSNLSALLSRKPGASITEVQCSKLKLRLQLTTYEAAGNGLMKPVIKWVYLSSDGQFSKIQDAKN